MRLLHIVLVTSILCAAGLFVSSCGDDSDGPCVVNSDCPMGLLCRAGVCEMAGPRDSGPGFDSFVPPIDSGPAEVDSGSEMDAPEDTGVEEIDAGEEDSGPQDSGPGPVDSGPADAPAAG